MVRELVVCWERTKCLSDKIDCKFAGSGRVPLWPAYIASSSKVNNREHGQW